MVRSDSSFEQSRWNGWGLVLAILVACILLLKLLG
jgi:hypothetical protein